MLKFSGVTRLDLAGWKGTRDRGSLGSVAHSGGRGEGPGQHGGGRRWPRRGVRRTTAGAQRTGGLHLTLHPMGRGKKAEGKEARAMSPPRENATAARTARVRHRLKERVLGRFRVEEIRINFRTTG